MSEGTDQIPASRFAGTATDDSGHPMISTDNATGDVGFGDSLVSFIQRGLWNADFVDAPDAPDAEITLENPLPRWPLTLQGTGVHPFSVEDAASASGRVLRFDMASGAANDEAYVEQIVRVNGSRGRSFAYSATATVLTPTVSNGIIFRINAQYLRKDRTTTGTEDEEEVLFSAITGPLDIAVSPPSGYPVAAPIPTDAYYIRVQIGIRRAAAADTATGSIDVCETRVMVVSDQLGVVDSTTPGNAPTTFTKVAGTTNVNPGSSGLWNFTFGAVVFAQQSQSSLSASDTISASTSINFISATAPRTMTSTPTVADGVVGQVLILRNSGANAITIQDQGTLANSGLRLSTTTFAMAENDNITLLYSGVDWVEISRTNVI